MKKIYKDKLANNILFISATSSIFVVFLIFSFLIKESLPFFHERGLSELLGTKWMPVSFQAELYGVLPLLSGSLLVTVLATAMAVSFGLCGAIYISEISSPREKEILKPFVEILAGIPSVVFGFFGLIVLAPFIKTFFNIDSGLTALTGSILLALMAIPTILSISEDALSNVPVSYREASLALGSNKLQTILKVTVPAAFPGIIASIMLGMGRVLGETMAVMMVTGNAATVTFSPFDSVRTLTATIA